jgi:hypothetical protein
MRKHFNPHQKTLKLGSTIPPQVKARLAELRAECVRRSEDNRRKQRALENAERYETWQEVCLSSIPMKGRR